jgi:DNA-binding NarL/FixJ family response regulator
MTESYVSEQITPVVKKCVFVIDDHPLLRQGLAMLINQQADMRVCGEAEDMRVAMQCIVQLNPDIIVLDISLKGPDGLEVLKTIRATKPDLPVLVLSMHDEATYAERAIRARANGYIMKQEATEKVLVAIRRILDGEVYLSDAMSKKLLQQFIDGTSAPMESRVAVLSDRELEVFRLIGEGRATREIAQELHLSVKTVETYQAHIKEKLGLKSGRELIQQAIQWKINGKAEVTRRPT